MIYNDNLIKRLQEIVDSLVSRDEKPPPILLELITHCKTKVHSGNFVIDDFGKLFQACKLKLVELAKGGYIVFKNKNDEDNFFRIITNLKNIIVNVKNLPKYYNWVVLGKIKPEDLLKHHKFFYVAVANVEERKKNPNTPSIFQVSGDGLFIAIPLSGNIYGLVPRFGIEFSDYHFVPYGFSKLFECENFKQGDTFTQVLLRSPALFEFRGNKTWHFWEKGKIILSSEKKKIPTPVVVPKPVVKYVADVSRRTILKTKPYEIVLEELKAFISTHKNVVTWLDLYRANENLYLKVRQYYMTLTKENVDTGFNDVHLSESIEKMQGITAEAKSLFGEIQKGTVRATYFTDPKTGEWRELWGSLNKASREDSVLLDEALRRKIDLFLDILEDSPLGRRIGVAQKPIKPTVPTPKKGVQPPITERELINLWVGCKSIDIFRSRFEPLGFNVSVLVNEIDRQQERFDSLWIASKDGINYLFPAYHGFPLTMYGIYSRLNKYYEYENNGAKIITGIRKLVKIILFARDDYGGKSKVWIAKDRENGILELDYPELSEQEKRLVAAVNKWISLSNNLKNDDKLLEMCISLGLRVELYILHVVNFGSGLTPNSQHVLIAISEKAKHRNLQSAYADFVLCKIEGTDGYLAIPFREYSAHMLIARDIILEKRFYTGFDRIPRDAVFGKIYMAARIRMIKERAFETYYNVVNPIIMGYLKFKGEDIPPQYLPPPSEPPEYERFAQTKEKPLTPPPKAPPTKILGTTQHRFLVRGTHFYGKLWNGALHDFQVFQVDGEQVDNYITGFEGHLSRMFISPGAVIPAMIIYRPEGKDYMYGFKFQTGVVDKSGRRAHEVIAVKTSTEMNPYEYLFTLFRTRDIGIPTNRHLTPSPPLKRYEFSFNDPRFHGHVEYRAGGPPVIIHFEPGSYAYSSSEIQQIVEQELSKGYNANEIIATLIYGENAFVGPEGLAAISTMTNMLPYIRWMGFSSGHLSLDRYDFYLKQLTVDKAQLGVFVFGKNYLNRKSRACHEFVRKVVEKFGKQDAKFHVLYESVPDLARRRDIVSLYYNGQIDKLRAEYPDASVWIKAISKTK